MNSSGLNETPSRWFTVHASFNENFFFVEYQNFFTMSRECYKDFNSTNVSTHFKSEIVKIIVYPITPRYNERD